MSFPTVLMTRARALAVDARAVFVIVNVATNLLFLVRSFVTMQLLDYRELGLAALLQSIVLLLSMLQFGFFQGGYRLLCSAEGAEARRINNLVYSFIGATSAIALVAGGFALTFVRGEGYALVGLAGIVGGAATLCKTWMTNQLVAGQNLGQLNRATFWSAAISMAMLALAPYDRFLACILAVVMAPIAFVALVARLAPSTLPNRWEASFPLIRRVLAAGFVVFTTSVFLQANVQIERWYVAGELGLPALGHLYLAILYLTIFQLVPTSLDAIFLPRLVRAHEGGPEHSVAATMRTMFWVVTVYTLLAVAVTALLAEPIVRLTLPKYLPDLTYVFWLMPGLVLFTLTQPLAMIFNVLIRYRSYFVAYGGSTVLTVAAFGGAVAIGERLSLETVMLVRSAAYAWIAIAVIVGFAFVSRGAPAFRFGAGRAQ